MSESFDPYFKWLGIPAEEQPPNHYRLLGVPLFIDDADVIANAADRQMSHVRTFQSGKNFKLTQQILNEISTAKICLLEANDKAAYDRSLSASLDEAKKPTRTSKPLDAPKPAATPKAPAAAPRKAPALAAGPLPQPSQKSVVPIVVAAVVVLLAVVGVGAGIYFTMFGNEAVAKVANGEVAQPVAPNGTAEADAGESSGSATAADQSSGEIAANEGAATDVSDLSDGSDDEGQGPTEAPQPPKPDSANGKTSGTSQAVGSAVPRLVSFAAPESVDGLELFPFSDGPFVMETADGSTMARATDEFLYFSIDDETLFELPNDTRQLITIRVTLWDDVPGKFTLQYDGHPVSDGSLVEDDAWVAAMPVEVEGSGQWRTVEFLIRRPRFANRQQARADFRIACWEGYRIAVRSVDVEHRERTVYTLDEPIDLLKTVDLERHRIWGDWSLDGEAVISPSLNAPARVQVPFEAPDQYVLTVDVERVEGDNMFAIGLPVQGGQTVVSLDAKTSDGPLSCLQTVDNENCFSIRNITRRLTPAFSNGVPTTITCIVRNAGVEVRQDGKPIIQYAGDLRRLDEGRVWDVPDRGAFILGAWNSVFRITRMEIAPLGDRPQSSPGRRYLAAEMKLVGPGYLYDYGLGLWGDGSNAVVEHDFPKSGNYALRASAFENHVGDESAEMAILVDGAAVARFDVAAVREAPEVYEAQLPIEAGRHKVSLLYRNDARTNEGDRNLFVTYLEIAPAVPEEAAPPPAVARQPVPAKEARDAALTEIKTLFRDEYENARKPEELLALAEKLGELAGKLKAEPTERFVVISEVWRLGRDAGHAGVALSALNELAGEYEIDAWDLRSKTLTAVLRNAKSPEARSIAAQRALELTEQAVAADRFGEAEDFAKTALAATSRARDAQSRELKTRATEWVRDIKSLEEQWQAVQSASETLKTNADDPAANLSFGKYLCFAKGDWRRGLPYLTKSGDALFATVATGEQQDPADANAQMELGDAWWDLVDDATSYDKKPIIARACHWYRRSLTAGLAGLERKKIEKRLEEYDTSYQPSDVDLVGHWTFDEDTATSVRDSTGNRHGRVIGKVAWNRNGGRLGSALQLDGQGYVSFDEADFGDQFTIALWAKLDQTDQVHCLVSNRQGGHVVPGFTLRANDSNNVTHTLSFDSANGSTKSWLQQKNIIQFNQWHHIAVTISRTAGLGALYLDGKLIASSRAIRRDFTTRAPWRIGYYANGSMKGQMDDLRIYRRAMTAQEIAALSRM